MHMERDQTVFLNNTNKSADAEATMSAEIQENKQPLPLRTKPSILENNLSIVLNNYQ